MLRLCKVADEGEGAPVSREDVTRFLVQHPNPDDSAVHALAEGAGKDVHATEENIYQLATMAERFLSGGKANEMGITEADVPQDQIQQGVEVEKEHTTDPFTAKRIALDHLAESDKYYTALAKMEKGLEGSDKQAQHLCRAYAYGTARAAHDLGIPFANAEKIARYWRQTRR